MTMPPDVPPPRSDAQLTVSAGRAVTIDLRMTSLGLLSFGAIVAGILLSTAVIVAVAGEAARRTAKPGGR